MTIAHLLNKAHWNAQVGKGIKSWPERGASASLWKTGRWNTVISLALGTAFMLNWLPVGKVWKAILWSSNIYSSRILYYQVDNVQRALLRRDVAKRPGNTCCWFINERLWLEKHSAFLCFPTKLLFICLFVCFNILLWRLKVFFTLGLFIQTQLICTQNEQLNIEALRLLSTFGVLVCF